MTDDLIFRKSGDLSPDQKFQNALAQFKNTIVENPRKAKLLEEQELHQRQLSWVQAQLSHHMLTKRSI